MVRLSGTKDARPIPGMYKIANNEGVIAIIRNNRWDTYKYVGSRKIT